MRKSSFAFFIGVINVVAISYTITFYYYFLTYAACVWLGLATGYLIQKLNLSQKYVWLALFPMVALGLYGLWVNPLLFPFFNPATEIIYGISLAIGYFYQPSIHLNYLAFCLTWLLLVGGVGYWVVPHYLYVGHENKRNEKIPAIKVNDWELTSMTGQPVSLKEFHGKTVLLNFTWKNCPPCRLKESFLNELENQLESRKDFQLLHIYLGEYNTLNEAAAFAKTRPSATWLYDANNKLARQMDYHGAPHEVILNKDGKIVAITSGFTRDVAVYYVDRTFDKLVKLMDNNVSPLK